jgi:hypothetical protein
MKFTKTLATGLLLLALTPVVMAGPTINITGSTAFRAITHQAIVNAMGASGVCAWEGTGANLKDSNRACFKGTVAGITNTIINCNWSGSVNGMQDVGNGLATPNWIDPATATFAPSATAPFGNVYAVNAAPKVSLIPTLANSDVYQASTSVTQSLDDTLGGVIPFRWVVSQNAPATFTNMTDQLHEALWGIGSQPLSMFTGNAADTKIVYAIGRDKGSGTRVTRLAETRYGITRPVVQWRVTSTGTQPNTNVTDIRLWPSLVEEPTNISGSLNDPTIQGNGGYSSNSSLSTAVSGTSSSVNVRDALNNILAGGQDILLVAHMGAPDATTAVGNGGKELTYNGVLYSADNVRTGKYTAWGYLHVLNRSGEIIPGSDEETVRDSLIASFATALTPFPGQGGLETGVDIGTMQVSRSEDGGLVGP